MGALDVGEHVGLAIEAGVADVALVRALVGVDVHVLAIRLDDVEASRWIADGALMRLKRKKNCKIRIRSHL